MCGTALGEENRSRITASKLVTPGIYQYKIWRKTPSEEV